MQVWSQTKFSHLCFFTTTLDPYVVALCFSTSSESAAIGKVFQRSTEALKSLNWEEDPDGRKCREK